MRILTGAVPFLLLMCCSTVQAEEPRASAQERGPAQSSKIAFRASTLIGMNVRNEQDQIIGMINDFVVDLEQKEIRYLAVSYGGFLGLGDKLFAVPVNAFEVRRNGDPETYYLVLKIADEKLRKAPGFNPNQWPNVADPKWQHDVDEYYQSRVER